MMSELSTEEMLDIQQLAVDILYTSEIDGSIPSPEASKWLYKICQIAKSHPTNIAMKNIIYDITLFVNTETDVPMDILKYWSDKLFTILHNNTNNHNHTEVMSLRLKIFNNVVKQMNELRRELSRLSEYRDEPILNIKTIDVMIYGWQNQLSVLMEVDNDE